MTGRGVLMNRDEGCGKREGAKDGDPREGSLHEMSFPRVPLSTRLPSPSMTHRLYQRTEPITYPCVQRFGRRLPDQMELPLLLDDVSV